MAAVGRSICFAHYDMCMQTRLALPWHNIAAERENLNLFVNGDCLVILPLAVKKTQADLAEGADRAQMRVREPIGICEFQQPCRTSSFLSNTITYVRSPLLSCINFALIIHS